MKDILLGKKTAVPDAYDPGVLYAIPRTGRDPEVFGFDLWRCYELSWLNEKGRPAVALLEVVYPVESLNIVESKSLKLYLNGLSNTRFPSVEEVRSTISSDLERLLCTPWIKVAILEADPSWEHDLPGTCIDGLDAEVPEAGPDPAILSQGEEAVEEALFSHVLKTSCPITLQPDWASVLVAYRGWKIDHGALLSYLCSYRFHAGFSEECCERIYRDILQRCRPDELKVGCFYTRRGGIDINPVRASRKVELDEMRKYRLIRQ